MRHVHGLTMPGTITILGEVVNNGSIFWLGTADTETTRQEMVSIRISDVPIVKRSPLS
jgi:hypothetical protein